MRTSKDVAEITEEELDAAQRKGHVLTEDMDEALRDQMERLLFTAAQGWEVDEESKDNFVTMVQEMIEGTWVKKELDRKWYL